MWIAFVSAENRTLFEFDNQQICLDLFKAFFPEKDCYYSQPVEKNNQLLSRLSNAIKPYKVPPKFKVFINRIEKLEEGKLFFLLFNQVDDLTFDLLRNIIIILEKKFDENETEARIRELYSLYFSIINIHNMLTKDYQITSRTCELTRDQRIGEANKRIRRCIFCNCAEHDGAEFTKDAHAISEGLGNKHLIQNEECDICNEWFGNIYEEDCMNYFSIYKQVFHIRSKHESNPKIRLRGYGIMTNIIDPNGKKIPSILAPNTSGISDSQIKVTLNDKVNLRNVYKLFCKFAIGSLERKDIHGYETTIDWIRGRDNRGVNLPMIAQEICKNVSKMPEITIYKRADNKGDLPASFVQLKIFNLLLWYYIPFCYNECINQAAWKQFLETYIISKNRVFNFIDMNLDEKVYLSYIFNFTKS